MDNQDNKMINRVFAALSFLISAAVYFKTMAPTVSFWDCGEFIACSFRLSIPHPPGAPFYLLLGRVFTLIPEFLVENIAARVNIISALSSALTVLFLHLIIAHFIRQYIESEEGFLRFVPSLGGLIGALTLTFSHSFWFNAVEAEVYALSMLFTSMFVWLVLWWSEKSDAPGNEKILLLIAYLMGLAMGVHILNALVLPMVVMIVYYKKFEINLFSFLMMGVAGLVLTAILYPGVVKGIPGITKLVGFGGLAMLIIMVIGVLFFMVNQRFKIASLFVTSMLLITIGYSAYLMIYIRSNLDPNIDENNPETIEKFISYMNREQYGDHHLDREKRRQESPNGNRYQDASEFFWGYQINEMYIRYFKWNFGGIEDTEDYTRERKRADMSKFGWVMLLGYIGLFYHFYRDWKNGLAVFVLFFMTGLAIVLYLNQPDPQPRERDYSYVGSFFAFAIWIGIGAAAILEWVTKFFQQKNIPGGNALGWMLAVLILVICPGRMAALNYKSHDRSGNYVAWDYSYNMLVSSDKSGIMFTNGDNDTFPLWYLQEVENVRTDVRVANLSLLNTDWYISQLKHKDPKVPISLGDKQIEDINLQPWPNEKTFEVPTIPEEIRRAEAKEYRLSIDKDSASVPDKMSFKVRPKIQIPTRDGRQFGALRVQDLMILNILSTNRFSKPVYFAVTTSEQNRMDGLKQYQRMDGLLFKVTTIPDWDINPETLYDNLMNKFRYTNLNNPDVYYNDNIIGLLQNYRSAFFRLATHYLTVDNKDRFKEVVQKLYEVMPPSVIPYTNNQFEEVMTALAVMGDIIPIASLTTENYSLRQLHAIGQVGMNYKDYPVARVGYEAFIKEVEKDPNSPLVDEYLRALFRRQRLSETDRTRAIETSLSQSKRELIRIYKELEDYDAGIGFLESWLETEPGNQFATKQLEEFKKLKENKDKNAS